MRVCRQQRVRWKRAALFWLLFAGACSHEVNGVMCVSGDQKSCPCLSGGQGVQVCLADGTYDSCICPGMGVASNDLSVAAIDLGGDDAGGGDQGVPADLGDTDANDLARVDLATPPDVAQAAPDLAGADLSGSDLSQLDFGGVLCGMETCSGAQICCLNGTPTNGSCSPSSGCDGGASPFACDGPEDCSGRQCCVNVDVVNSNQSGNSYCSTPCPSALLSVDTNGNYTESSILCHSSNDCSGYAGAVYVAGLPLGTLPFSVCCYSTRTAPYSVCMNSTFASSLGYTCP